MEAPSLPATELADSCYTRMFTACTGLKKAAELPATKLSHHCYAYMYVACSNLTDVPDFPEFVPAIRNAEKKRRGIGNLLREKGGGVREKNGGFSPPCV